MHDKLLNNHQSLVMGLTDNDLCLRKKEEIMIYAPDLPMLEELLETSLFNYPMDTNENI